MPMGLPQFMAVEQTTPQADCTRLVVLADIDRLVRTIRHQLLAFRSQQPDSVSQLTGRAGLC